MLRFWAHGLERSSLGRRLCNNSSNTGVLEGQLEANVTLSKGLA